MNNIDIVKIKMVKEGEMSFDNTQVTSPKIAAEVTEKFLSEADREYLIVLCLNTKNKVNCINVVSVGTLNMSLASPREIFKPVILANSCSFIIAHNHPSGDPAPSNEDKKLTLRIRKCGRILGIDLLDSIIVGDNSYFSFKANDML